MPGMKKVLLWLRRGPAVNAKPSEAVKGALGHDASMRMAAMTTPRYRKLMRHERSNGVWSVSLAYLETKSSTGNFIRRSGVIHSSRLVTSIRNHPVAGYGRGCLLPSASSRSQLMLAAICATST